MKRSWLLIPVLLVALSCRQTPDYVIQEDDMAELLADIQVANAVVELNLDYYNNDSLKKVVKQSVFARHNVTQEQFDTSLMWYGHNLDIYKDIYENVTNILENRQKEVQQEARKAGQQLVATGDSVDIWNGSHNLLFDKRQNGETIQLAFSLSSDNDSRPGDRYVWKLDAKNTRQPADLLIGIDYKDGTSEYQTKSTTPEYATEVILQADSTKLPDRIYGYLLYRMKTETSVFVNEISLTRTRLNKENYTSHPYQKKWK